MNECIYSGSRMEELTIWALLGLGSLFSPPSLSWNFLALHVCSSSFSTGWIPQFTLASCVPVRAQIISCSFCLMSPTCLWVYNPQAAGRTLDGLFSQVFTTRCSVLAGELGISDALHWSAFSARAWVMVRF